MTVDYSNFWQKLPALMGGLVDSRWVAIDLEMTGISTTGRPIPSNSTPQEAYRLVKEVAEMYQIIQIGFTFCKYNNSSSRYETKTIECQVSPLFHPGIGANILTRTLNRTFTTSATTYAFLKNCNFPLDTVINAGIPYLSREEEAKVKAKGIPMFSDTQVDFTKLTGKALNFYRFYREKILSTVQNVHPRYHQGINILIQRPGRPLSSLEIKIIHSIVQKDFPFLVAMISDTGVANVVWANPGQEVVVQHMNTMEVNKYIGIRNVIDALAGEDFAKNIAPDWFPLCTYNWGIARVHGSNRPGFSDVSDMQQVQAILKNQSPILVGHNLFYDLAFIYRTFFGRLPDTLDEFLSAIHKLFPRIIDTKYMFNKSQPNGDPTLSLQSLHKMYCKNEFPIVLATDDFNATDAKDHHAGYDSLLTMVLFLKQTFRIKDTWSETQSVTETLPPLDGSGNQKVAAVSILDEQEDWEKATRSGLQRYSPLEPKQDETAAAPVAVVKNPILQQESLPHDSQDAQRLTQRHETYSVYEIPIIPPWEHPFWQVFGNRTRISNVCDVEFK
ncbi:CAF1-domain-containing protein [Nemania sp. NC0429]|nr:CAF1-domain-containing protein [Nemania sp. NC0429]